MNKINMENVSFNKHKNLFMFDLSEKRGFYPERKLTIGKNKFKYIKANEINERIISWLYESEHKKFQLLVFNK